MSERVSPAIARISLPIVRTSGICCAPGSVPGIRRIKAIDIGQQYQRIGHDQLRDPGSQAIVIAVTDFFGRDGIVFIDDRHDRSVEQVPKGAACIEKPPAVFSVIRRQQNLRRHYSVSSQRFLVGMHELDLTCRGRRLQIFETRAFLVDPQNRTTDRYCTRGDNERLAAISLEVRDVVGKCSKPMSIQLGPMHQRAMRNQL